MEAGNSVTVLVIVVALDELFLTFPHFSFLTFTTFLFLLPLLEALASDGQNKLTEKPLSEALAVHRASASFRPDC